MADPEMPVRLRAAQLAPMCPPGPRELHEGLLALLGDDEPLVAVASLVAIGDLEAVELAAPVSELARRSKDALVVEEAVATLGALGAPEGRAVIFELLPTAKPALRRRCVAALGAYEGDEVEAALDQLSSDRDWQVRQAVAMLRRED